MRDWWPIIAIGFGSAALALCSGCDDLRPSEPLPDAEIEGWTYAMVGSVTMGPAPQPVTPPDEPKPGDVCPTCGGKGRVGDGRVSTKCEDCNGTGIWPGDDQGSPRDAEPQMISVGTLSVPVASRSPRSVRVYTPMDQGRAMRRRRVFFQRRCR